MLLMLDIEWVAGVWGGMLPSHLVVLVVIAYRVSYAFPGFASLLFSSSLGANYHIFYLLENQLMTFPYLPSPVLISVSVTSRIFLLTVPIYCLGFCT